MKRPSIYVISGLEALQTTPNKVQAGRPVTDKFVLHILNLKIASSSEVFVIFMQCFVVDRGSQTRQTSRGYKLD